MASKDGSGPSSKKLRIDEKEAADSGTHGKAVPKAVEDCQKRIFELNEKASADVLKIQCDYNQLRRPLYDERSELVKEVPNFWATAIIKHPRLSSYLTAEEEKCLMCYLVKLDVEEVDGGHGQKIKFYFMENPYFENDLLVKELHRVGEEDQTSTSSEIRWKENGEEFFKLPQMSGKVVPKISKRDFQEKTLFFWLRNNGEDSQTLSFDFEMCLNDIWSDPVQYFKLENDGDSDSSYSGTDESEENLQKYEDKDGLGLEDIYDDEFCSDSDDEDFVLGDEISQNLEDKKEVTDTDKDVIEMKKPKGPSPNAAEPGETTKEGDAC